MERGGKASGRVKAARPDLLWPPSPCQPAPGRQTQFICFIGAKSLREGKGVLQQISLANCWSNEQLGSKLAHVSHCSLILMSDLDALSLFSHCNGASVQQDRTSGPDSVCGATLHTRSELQACSFTSNF